MLIVLIFTLITILGFVYKSLSFEYKQPIREKFYTFKTYVEIKTHNYEDGQNEIFVDFSKKKILAIGDSQTAAFKWQNYLAHLIHADINTHAKGGIGMLEMVDGQIPQPQTNGVDPNNFGVSYIPSLRTKDVVGKDYIIIMGLYNENKCFEEYCGTKHDLYPRDTTYCGKFNYMVTRIKNELNKANNTKCTIILVTPHIFGKYPYNDKDAYHYKNIGMIDTLKTLSSYNDIKFCDLTNLSGIDSTNWNIYQSGKFLDKNSPYYSIAKYPQNNDNLHLNHRGQMKVAVAVAKWMSSNLIP